MVSKTVSIIVIIEVIFRDQKTMDKIHGANPPTTVDAEPLGCRASVDAEPSSNI